MREGRDKADKEQVGAGTSRPRAQIAAAGVPEWARAAARGRLARAVPLRGRSASSRRVLAARPHPGRAPGACSRRPVCRAHSVWRLRQARSAHADCPSGPATQSRRAVWPCVVALLDSGHASHPPHAPERAMKAPGKRGARCAAIKAIVALEEAVGQCWSAMAAGGRR